MAKRAQGRLVRLNRPFSLKAGEYRFENELSNLIILVLAHCDQAGGMSGGAEEPSSDAWRAVDIRSNSKLGAGKSIRAERFHFVLACHGHTHPSRAAALGHAARYRNAAPGAGSPL